MYAGVPCYNLKKLAREIVRRHARARARSWHLAEIAKLATQQSDPDYQVRHAAAVRLESIRDDPAGGGGRVPIGELAPDGLRLSLVKAGTQGAPPARPGGLAPGMF